MHRWGPRDNCCRPASRRSMGHQVLNSRWAINRLVAKYNVQLLGPNGEPISPIVEIELKGDSRANLAYIIFRQNH